MNNIAIIFQKQIKDILKNKTVLIEFIIFPLMAFIMTKTVQIQDMPAGFFVKLFAVMYIGMAPLTGMSAIIAEEKEKNTLRVLLMADVTPAQYLTGTGGCVFLISMAGAGAFCAISGYSGPGEKALFLLLMAIGSLVSMLIGAVIGAGCKSQMSATSVAVPVMMTFSFLPMLSMFNETIKKAAEFAYSRQIMVLMDGLGKGQDNTGSVVIIVLNMMLFGGLFGVLYKKGGLGGN